MEKSTEEIRIGGRLRKMVDMARMLQENKDLFSQCVKNDCYVRIGGESFRAVSLKKDYPLCGCVKIGAKRLEIIERHFNEFEKKQDKLQPSVLKKKKERTLQCWIIREALKSDRDLLGLLGIKGQHFDELRFALDEVSLGDKHHKVCDIPGINLKNEKKCNAVRCDLLAVGRRGSEIFPVIIELKSNRNMTRLKEQLHNFAELIGHFRDDFKNLLDVCTGLPLNDYTLRKIIIWPTPTSQVNNKTEMHLNELIYAGINVLEYNEESNGYKFIPHWAKK
jgi:hypothetical protein